MAISYVLAPNPKWYFADLTGKPLGAGYIKSYRSLNKTEQKPIYQDEGGLFEWPNPVLIDENGTQGPLYFQVDSLDGNEKYYLEVYDRNDNLQWTIDKFPSGQGGGGTVTTAISLNNIVSNSVLWRNTGDSPVPLPSTWRVAPGANTGLATTPSLAYPDIYFFKDGVGTNDQIRLIDFTLGLNPLTGDVTPDQYFNYTNPVPYLGETYKYLQIPITAKVNSFNNVPIAFSYWARGNSGVTQIQLVLRQFFGDGTVASPDVLSVMDTETLAPGWNRYTGTFTVPSISTKILGECGNDGVFLQINFPLGFACDIDICKPTLYVGSIFNEMQYLPYDQIDALINTARTGQVITIYGQTSLPGYVYMNDGTIGSATSGATTRANQDTFPLYNLLWNNIVDTWCPVTGGRGANAIADFVANKPMALPRQLGRVLAAAGQGSGLPNWAQGEFLGEATHIMLEGEMFRHNHPPTGAPNLTGKYVGEISTPATATFPLQVGTVGNTRNPAITMGQVGNSDPFNVMQPTTFTNFFIKL